MKLYCMLLVLSATVIPLTSWPFVDPQNDAETKATNGNARIEGTVKTRVANRGAVPYALVKLFPDPAFLQRPDLIRTARADNLGTFRIENVVPGKYRVIAFTGGGQENLNAEATLAAHNGITVELSENESKGLTLYVYLAQ